MEHNPLKTSKPKADEILKPTSPLDGISTAQPSGLPLKPVQRPHVPLITYAYAESTYGRANLQFFVNHGLHAAADFIFILNGETDVDEVVIPKNLPNVKIVKRPNKCFDLGAHWEVLSKKKGRGSNAKALKDIYKKFILMNASIRGPFVPHWSKECWTDAYLNKLNDKVKVGNSSLLIVEMVSMLMQYTARWINDKLHGWRSPTYPIHDLRHRQHRPQYHADTSGNR